MIDLEGITLSDDDIALISNKHIGGIILFSRNFKTFLVHLPSAYKYVVYHMQFSIARVKRFLMKAPKVS